VVLLQGKGIGVLQCAAGCCRVLQCVAVCCSVLQCVAVCCSVLQRFVVCCSVLTLVLLLQGRGIGMRERYVCCTLQHTATHCNTLQHTATHCNTLQHTASHCNALQRTATHCNALQCKISITCAPFFQNKSPAFHPKSFCLSS